ncbi:MAG TPA: type IV secretion system DNA-binding domain-containing protein [Bryobacteraceae bacterium]|nr:type IV secretion system DNA-binding domain-containing protein [Bryobacteraceae bacterium]
MEKLEQTYKTNPLVFNTKHVFPLRIKRKHESQNGLIIGDIGSGKSTFQRGLLHQVQERGEVAIIHDPHREFVEEFYRPERGDIILNPLDARFPFWAPGLEVEQGDEAQALMLGKSLYAVEPGDQPFFKKQAAALFAFLVAYHRPSGRELGDWMANDHLLDAKVKGTEFERTLTKDSAGQRAGIIGVTNEAGPAFRLLPDQGDRSPFSTKEWARTRRGWIFVTNTLETRDALRPLQSMWLDLLIARVISMGPQKHLPNVWMILDELAALQKLPQLKVAITENRKAGFSIVVGFHGKSQIEGIYGKDADTIFAMPKMKILLRTAEADCADWASRLIGSVEVERVRETRPAHEFLTHGRGHSYSTERREERLVLASEIQSLPDLQGYLRYEDVVVPVRFTLLPKTKIAEPYIPAPIPLRWNPPDPQQPDSSSTPANPKNPPPIPPQKHGYGVELSPNQVYGAQL